MYKTKRTLIAMLAVLVMATSVMLCACDNTPSEYKPKKFYGTYTQFANDYYFVTCSVYNEELEGRQAIVFDNIISINEGSYVCSNIYTEEIEEKEADPRLLAKVQELINKMGTSVTVKKKEIIYDDTGTVVEYDGTGWGQINQYGLGAKFIKGDKTLGIGVYEEEGTRIFYVGFVSIPITIDGIDYEIDISRAYKE